MPQPRGQALAPPTQGSFQDSATTGPTAATFSGAEASSSSTGGSPGSASGVIVYRATHQRQAVSQKSVRTYNNSAHLRRDTLRLDLHSGATPWLSFVFDSEEAVSVHVSFAGSTSRIDFPAGLGQRHDGAISSLPTTGSPELVIELIVEVHRGRPAVDREITRVRVGGAVAGSGFEVLSQEVLLDGVKRQLLDVYGLVETQHGGEVTGAEPCAVCLGAPRSTVVLPCRHCCVCIECAPTMHATESRCPICRQTAVGLLQVDDFGANS